VALFNGPKGIWTVDLTAKAKGREEIQAKLKNAIEARVVITVVDKIQLPAATTEEGLLVRLFLAESRTPSESGYDASKVKTGMQWMRLVLVNRLKNNPSQFAAPGAKKILDIVKAKNQFKGFENYPRLKAAQVARIHEILRIAHNDSDSRQEKYEHFLLNAIEVAKNKQMIKDPCPTGLYGWRTAGSVSPGGRFTKFMGPLSGNQFYTLKK